jgi:hypothetical protein
LIPIGPRPIFVPEFFEEATNLFEKIGEFEQNKWCRRCNDDRDDNKCSDSLTTHIQN